MNALEIWTVFDHPTDFPYCFIARKALVTAMNEGDCFTDEYVTADTLEEVRAKICSAMPHVGHSPYMIPRSPEDDPVIVECWL